ncbi:MAG: hypothetical protein ACO26Z_06020 [Candidatus Nanopelagicaceae bacterium]
MKVAKNSRLNRKLNNQSGSATAELVVALPIIITVLLVGVNFLGETMQRDRLRYLAEGVVQAVMRDESEIDIAREVGRSLPGAQFSIVRNHSDGTFRVTVRYQAASATAVGLQ